MISYCFDQKFTHPPDEKKNKKFYVIIDIFQFCTSSFGWRWAFYFHAIVTLVLFVVWVLIYKDDPQYHRVRFLELLRFFFPTILIAHPSTFGAVVASCCSCPGKKTAPNVEG